MIIGIIGVIIGILLIVAGVYYFVKKKMMLNHVKYI